MTYDFDVIVIGAGGAGMMCAAEAGKRGRRVWLIDHAKKLAEKIRISGGGRCNFTNLYATAENYLSQNPHFCKSALKRYTVQDFIDLVERHGIAYHEKTLGQLFCDNSSQQIIDMLKQECQDANVRHDMETTIDEVAYDSDGFYRITTSRGVKTCESLVIATGGLSIPKIGATKFGYEVAKQFGHTIIPTRAALVPLMFQASLLEQCKSLSGLSVHADVHNARTSFAEGLLFTHRGLSGPSILQISSYWQEGETITVNLAPDYNMVEALQDDKAKTPKQNIQSVLGHYIPKRLAQMICDTMGVTGNIAELSDEVLSDLAQAVQNWTIKPSGTEGYRTAEVTLGGVNTDEISSKTMESNIQKGLYFIGEVVDVTGHLGGFNFQWAWSSGFAAGQYV